MTQRHSKGLPIFLILSVLDHEVSANIYLTKKPLQAYLSLIKTLEVKSFLEWKVVKKLQRETTEQQHHTASATEVLCAVSSEQACRVC